jgi:hypothetical protein
MANEIIPIHQAQAPARMRERMAQGLAVNKNFSDGIRDAFPTISIKGKIFRFRHQGEEQLHVDPQTRYPIPYLDVVFVNGSRNIAKVYYAKGYTEGDMDPPDCWSLDSIKPDASVQNKVNPVCLTCPMNRFGSRVTEAGKQAKACQDSRRIAVVLPHHFGSDKITPVLMRIPQSSLKNLKGYVDMLERYGFEPNGCKTRLSFDMAEAFPKLTFEFAGAITDTQYDEVLDMVDDDRTVMMLTAPIDGPAADEIGPEAAPTQAARATQQGYAGFGQDQPAPAPEPQPQPSATVHAFPGGMPQAQPPQQPAPAPVQAAPAPAPAPETARAPEPAPAPNSGVPTVIPLPNGQFFNVTTQAYCNADGSPLGAPAPQQPAQAQPPAQEPQQTMAFAPPASNGPAPTWTPPGQAPAQAAPPAPAPEIATPPKTRKRPAAAAQPPAQANGASAPAPAVSAAPPALDSLLSSLLPK